MKHCAILIIAILIALSFLGCKEEPVPVCEHIWDSGTVRREPTCIMRGIVFYTCSVCGELKESIIPALGHTPDENHVCSVCGNFAPFIGPAGGYVFYDCDMDNESGNADGLISSECGWRYLEAAPSDLRVIGGIPCVDSSFNKDDIYGAGYGYARFMFGLYKTSEDGNSLYVNGSTVFDPSDCTGTAIGTGKHNTELIVGSRGEEAYPANKSTKKSGDYAARLCDLLSYKVKGVTFDDWFLPSKDELRLLYLVLYKSELGNFLEDKYCSSSESTDSPGRYWFHYFDRGRQMSSSQGYYDCFVRPIRAF